MARAGLGKGREEGAGRKGKPAFSRTLHPGNRSFSPGNYWRGCVGYQPGF